MRSSRYLILGNSAAGIGGVEGIRSVDPDGSITLVSAEPEHTYSRPLITYLLAGKVDASGMYYRERDYYKRQRVEALLGVAARQIDPAAHEVTLESGERFSYEKLLIGIGGVPVIPPIEGLPCPGVHTFTSWEDERKIKALVKEGEHAVVLGGGMIGLKSAEALHSAGAKVTVVELSKGLLAGAVDAVASGFLAGHLRARGIEVRLEETAVAVRPREGGLTVRLRSGEELPCRAFLVAVGVRPNAEIARRAGIKVDRGIVVDERMRTSEPDIYAAGDVVELPDRSCGVRRPIPILPLAYRGGLVAGINMAGGSERMSMAMPMNSVEVLGYPIVSVGRTSAGEGQKEIRWRSGTAYRKLVLEGDRIVGALFAGEIDRAGIVTGLIRDAVPVGRFARELVRSGPNLASLPERLRSSLLTR